MIATQPEEGLDHVTVPERPASESEEEEASELEANVPRRYPVGRERSSDAETQPAGPVEGRMGIIDDGVEIEDDLLSYFSSREVWPVGQQFSKTTFLGGCVCVCVCGGGPQGAVTCPGRPGRICQ